MKKNILFGYTIITCVFAFTGTTSTHGSHSHMRNEHNHHNPRDSMHESVLKDHHVIQDREHLKEELPSHLTQEDIDRMTPAELEYHYFRTHDLDKNNRLDGLEVMMALSHVVHQLEPSIEHLSPEEKEAFRKKKIAEFHRAVQEMEVMVDETLRLHDINKDGYITYGEFLKARRG